MVITDIKQQVKRADRFSIYADSKYVFSLSEAGLLQLGIFVGKEFAEGELESLRESAGIDKLYDQALRYIMLRPRSRWELQAYLKRKQPNEIPQRVVMDKLDENRLIDDVKFAQSWVESRRLLKSVSKRRLSQELRAKRVPDDAIIQVLAEDEADEKAVLRQLAEKKYQIGRYHDRVKLMQYLIRQGFQYDDVKQVVADLGSDGST